MILLCTIFLIVCCHFVIGYNDYSLYITFRDSVKVIIVDESDRCIINIAIIS